MTVVLTERELDIMGVLWRDGPSTAGEVRERLVQDAGLELAYNSVLTMLRILEEKGYAAHDEDGRAFRYRAVVERSAAEASAVERLVRRMFGGSESRLVVHLVKERGLPAAELARLRRMLDESLGTEAEES